MILGAEEPSGRKGPSYPLDESVSSASSSSPAAKVLGLEQLRGVTEN